MSRRSVLDSADTIFCIEEGDWYYEENKLEGRVTSFYVGCVQFSDIRMKSSLLYKADSLRGVVEGGLEPISIRDHEIEILAVRNRKLQEVKFLNAPMLSDKSIRFILAYCPDVRCVTIDAGSDQEGGVKGTFIADLNARINRHKWQELELISLVNQPLNMVDIKAILRKRPNLRIEIRRKVPKAVADSLSQAGITPPKMLHSFWEGGRAVPPKEA
ncbi:predicted protein [Pyrenophora tritici-repentis Pt-1C-BFP]|uniref:Uncharacterized protein n=1 Tax=Pyrenophora tritici-repentis (strain Pt-1C-BFP) TaxID=426418 RepID=B2WLS2_PYRTR|nr:uncharacterized protein PTRG_10932 [Pyrenophora tritici-repentis Pt-1C-BFP]EDU43982.1 predicted protein [Pyrenophora tritici-repentis Pt-1C-BFP]